MKTCVNLRANLILTKVSALKPSKVNASGRKAWLNGVSSRLKFSICVYLRLRLARALNVTSSSSENETSCFSLEYFIVYDVSRLDFRRFLMFSGEERGLLSRTAAGNPAYDVSSPNETNLPYTKKLLYLEKLYRGIKSLRKH